ncbi:MAG: aromatic hydrocarbon degradation protein [Comamonadaceae bacterium]|nr:aromatic hydrocarbon degradation protein [Comamonadaceae bacterium]
MPTQQRSMPCPMHTAIAAALLGLVSLPAVATNGMNLEAYGAKAGGMGGASFAYENGNSAMMNNPATLGLRQEGQNIGLGLTLMMPDVKTITPMGTTAESDGDKYWMPSISYMRKSGKFTYGVGMLAQGGMGTEYGSSLSGSPTMPFRSEVGFGRLMFPLAFNVNEKLTVAGQIDYVWASMDVQMSPDGTNYVSFSNNNDFSGAAKGNGWAYKLGAHYKLSDAFSVGATYHSKTDISDLEGSGTLNSNPARFKVIDFQWPETYGVGMAWQATPGFMLTADIKHIGWKDSMKDFRLSANVMGMGWNNFPPLPQNWKDQTVFMIGGQYMLRPGLALRAGINHASNPVPDGTLNPLFPATIETHYTFGVGWNIGGGHSVAGSLAIAPKVTRTNPNMFGPGVAGTVSHSQSTLRVNYNHSF